MTKRPTPVGTTKRKRLTKLQRSELHTREGGKCCICGLDLDKAKPFIDEHKRALGLGGSNDPKNRGIAHPHCADIKTREEDMPRITKAKAQGAAVVSRDPRAQPAMQSRGFLKTEKPSKAGRVRIVKLPVPGISEIARRYGVGR